MVDEREKHKHSTRSVVELPYDRPAAPLCNVECGVANQSGKGSIDSSASNRRHNDSWGARHRFAHVVGNKVASPVLFMTDGWRHVDDNGVKKIGQRASPDPSKAT